ncbi:SETMR methyltransferase, partial [Acromyrmex insinuator]
MVKNEFRAVIKHLHMKGLTPKEIKAELDNFQKCLKMFQRNPDEFLCRFITEEGKDREVGRKDDGHSFLRCTCIIHIDYLPSKQTINSDYYAALLDYFNNILHLAKKKVLFHQDNARVHTCPAPMTKFNKFRYELLPYPAYSPDLAPCDYFLFSNLK